MLHSRNRKFGLLLVVMVAAMVVISAALSGVVAYAVAAGFIFVSLLLGAPFVFGRVKSQPRTAGHASPAHPHWFK